MIMTKHTKILWLLSAFVYVTWAWSVPHSVEKRDAESDVAKLEEVVGSLSRQLMLTQLAFEEKTRSDGDSGIKQIRTQSDGTKTYHTQTHSLGRVCSIHDHANNIRTVGMGEFIGVLNGVEFRTRHNDYRLRMPSTTSTDYHETESIPFPDVPPEVLQKLDINEQLVEMREWFKAWRDQDFSVRDYRKYFKPILCYLEGAWTTNTETLDEPFESDRHFVDANSWFELQEKIRFTSYTGRKSMEENFAYLPTSIMNIINGTYPEFAQWNYRILCHPLKRDVSTKDLRVVDDASSRMGMQRTMDEHVLSRAARFSLNPKGDGSQGNEYSYKYGLLDELMEEIPGKDNYLGNITDSTLGQTVLHYNSGEQLNAAYYHRRFKVEGKDAMGVSRRSRGYSDRNLFVALNTQPKVSSMNLNYCKKKNTCYDFTARVSYAIPMEIIYLTPLPSWNPFDIVYKNSSSSAEGKTVTANKRNGGKTPEKAYNGTNSKLFYQTPDQFFTGENVDEDDPADTAKNTAGVLDRSGNVHIVRPTGTRIFLPNIEGIGVLRTRYPIMPVHGEGNTIWKELEAIKDMIMESQKYAHMFRTPLVGKDNGEPVEPPKKLTYELQGATNVNFDPGHVHSFDLDASQQDQLFNKRQTIQVVTTENSMHSHSVLLKLTNNGLKILKFDGKKNSLDQHGRWPILIEE